jgi:hypothetical protein
VLALTLAQLSPTAHILRPALSYCNEQRMMQHYNTTICRLPRASNVGGFVYVLAGKNPLHPHKVSLFRMLCDSVCNQSDSYLTAIVYHHVLFHFNLVSTVTRLQAGQSGVRILVGGRYFFLPHNAQTGSMLTHTAIEE